MKKIIIVLIITAAQLLAQTDSLRPANSILKNFKPFSTPRTNCRPGTVFRTDKNGVSYIVQDISSIKSALSEEGTIVGRMVFSKEELLELLNIEFGRKFTQVEVELKEAVREITEQTNVDNILWNNDLVDDLVVDDSSKYYIIREAILTSEIIYRFDKNSYDNIIVGKGNLKEKQSSGDQIVDFPYSITKKFKESKRLFFLEQKIGLKPYVE
ncbi:MAG: hypothetical protein CVV23_17060 [Ignavibacteriae bacterium HGW-Ignavibacteriae-2]|jgi:hypothetical protein|nr:hypothetical protein [Bacteroidota bacterium]PKL87111.1 MAG: hypothetical protein CVV23_17060 [Ignavibacteriae bacterium HGW-Ignavibacteriae-2]